MTWGAFGPLGDLCTLKFEKRYVKHLECNILYIIQALNVPSSRGNRQSQVSCNCCNRENNKLWENVD